MTAALSGQCGARLHGQRSGLLSSVSLAGTGAGWPPILVIAIATVLSLEASPGLAAGREADPLTTHGLATVLDQWLWGLKIHPVRSGSVPLVFMM